MKHIMIVCMHFYPVQFRVNDIALELVSRGYKVTVVTGIPNYPDAKFTKGYGLFKKRRENYEGIDIIRLPIFPRGNNSLSLVLNYFSFNFSGWFFSLFTRIKADHVFIYGTSPLLKAMVGLRYAKRRKIGSTLYVMDLWPESVQYAGGISNHSVLKYLTKKMEKIYRLSTHILISSRSFISSIKEKHVPDDKIIYWPQAAEELFTKESNEKASEVIRDNRLNLIFAGTIAVAQGLDILPETAVLLKRDHKKVRFIIVGDGRERESLVEKVNELGVSDYFQFTGKVPVAKVPSYFNQTDAAILTLTDTPIFRLTIPAKLQSYMTYGIPILTNVQGEVKEIIEESKSGLVASSYSVESFYEMINNFMKCTKEERKTMSINGKNYANKYFDRNQLMDQLENIMHQSKGV